ncbi:cobamide remodeling phosphodiesterase CbiR [Desulfosarcina ovata]|uniref:Xylose isomerase-like TIM barrel domain-containing protein n=1 Tax=Desulfosarcina ovata subsp. ovata TaxID=2752305 RepID=A0A5K8A8S1_9BACT|nr:cobamide remodeling phosphodiesterase CbiR [Desulfosarcina ovata]BBO88450.1 hypothetical protein DSCOOX_16300 [Desulfosarcina ovata subsp. ovata]
MDEKARRMATPFEPLTVSAKRAFPFTLACPSFIYRAGYAENVRHLAPFVDEIELLFFESRFADSLPSQELIRELADLGREGDITYNVHLPTDIHPGHRQTAEREKAVRVLGAFIDRCLPLSPSTFTLHLNRDPADHDIDRWQAATAASLTEVLAGRLTGRRISVENLDDTFHLAAPVIDALDLSVCMDMGHLMVYGENLNSFFDRWQSRIAIVHLHGVIGSHDHLPLDRLSSGRMARIVGLLNGFSGVVSLELFSRAALNASLERMIGQDFGPKG